MTADPLHALVVTDDPEVADRVDRMVRTAGRSGASATRMASLERLERKAEGAGSWSGGVVTMDIAGAACDLDDVEEVAREHGAPVAVLRDPDDVEQGVEALRRGAQEHLPREGGQAEDLVRRLRDARRRHGVREETRERVSFLESTVESSGEGVLVTDTDGGIVLVDDRFQEMWGIPDEVVETGDDDRLIEHVEDQLADAEAWRDRIRDIYEDPEASAVDVLAFEDGRYYERHTHPCRRNGEIVGRVWTFRDVTERERSEQALKASEERFRSVYENSSIGLYRTTPDGEILLANPAMVEMLGYDSLEELSETVLAEDRFHPEYSREEWKERLQEEGEVQGLESTWTRKDGDKIRVRESARAVRDEAGEVKYYDGTVEDVTDRWQAERKLERRNELLTALQDVSLGILEQLHLDAVLEEVVERTAEVLDARHAWIFVRDEDEEHLELRYTTPDLEEHQGLELEKGEGHAGLVWETGEAAVVDDYDAWERRAAEFPEGVIDALAGVPLEAGDEFRGVLGIALGEDVGSLAEEELLALERLGALAAVATEKARLVDDMEAEIRERRETEDALRERERELARSRERFRELAEHVDGIVWLTDPEKRELHFISDEYEEIWGRPIEELGDDPRKVLEGVHPEDRERVRRSFPEQTEGGYEESFRVVQPDGEIRWVRVRAEPVEDEDGDVVRIAGLTQDVTEERERKKALRQVRDRRAALFENSPSPVMENEFRDGLPVITDVNQAFEEVFELTRDEVLGEKVADVVVPEEGRDKHEDLATRLTEGERVRSEVRRVTEEGPRDFLLDVIPADIEGEPLKAYAWYTDITDRKRAEEALRRSEERYRTLVDAAPDAIYIVGLDGTIESINPAFEEITGWAPEEWEGRSIEDLLHPDDRAKAWEKIAEVAEGKDPVEAELRFRTKDGEPILAELVGSPRVVDGEIRGVIGIGRDITERRERERRLAENERRLRRAQHVADIGHWTWDVDEDVVRWSDQIHELWGVDPDAAPLTFDVVLRHVHPEDRDRFEAAVEEALETGEGYEMDHRVVRPDGEVLWMESRAEVVTDEEGEVTGLRGTSQDVTDVRESQEALAERTRRLETLISNLPGVVYRCRNEPGWPMELVEGESRDLLGYEASDLVEGDVSFAGDVIHPEDRQGVWEQVQAALDAGEPFELVYRVRTRDGEVRWVWERGRGLEDADGTTVLEGFITDITDRKRTEEALRESEARYRRVVEGAPDPICTIEPDGTVAATNTAWEEETGWTTDALDGRAFEEIVHDDDLPEAVAAFDRVLDGEKAQAEIRIHTADGSTMWAHAVGVPLYEDEEVETVLAVVRNITERKEAEDRLRTVKNFNQTLLENAPVGIAHVATDGSITYQNRELRRIRGIREDGQDPLDDTPIHRFGPVVERPELKARIRALLEEGEPFSEYQSPFETAEGEELHLALTGVPIEADGGDVDGAILLARDMTDERQLEREVERQTVQLIHSEKMAALGHLVGGITHEINNPLSVVTSNTELVEEGTERMMENEVLEEAFAGGDVDIDEILEEVVADENIRFLYEEGPEIMRRNLQNLRRISDFIESLRTFTQPDRDRSPADLDAVLEDTVELFLAQYQETVDLRTEWGDPPPVPCDESQMGQVAMNLLLNAAQACPDGAPVTLRTRSEGDEVIVEVEDQGEGIPQGDRDRIFDPFFTTKESDNMGLGLSITDHIVSDHGGSIEVESTLGEGTLFRVRLPLEGEAP